MNKDVLPDSRQASASGGKYNRYLGWWQPIFCANCGADGGYVPEENMTFAFYLCNDCAETWGEIANTYVEPDTVFWERVRQEQVEKQRMSQGA